MDKITLTLDIQRGVNPYEDINPGNIITYQAKAYISDHVPVESYTNTLEDVALTLIRTLVDLVAESEDETFNITIQRYNRSVSEES